MMEDGINGVQMLCHCTAIPLLPRGVIGFMPRAAVIQ